MTNMMILRSDMSLKIDKIIDHLREKTHPICIILTDIGGQLISYYTRFREINVENLGALFASNMGATAEIANEVLENDGFESNFHEGKQNNVFISKIADSFLMAVVFSNSTPIGIIRLFAKRACQELSTLLHDFEQQISVQASKNVNQNFSEELSKQFEDILSTKRS
ncbi:roadblock/LC7 domain-containing protein [candidate division KSB1 bacterium]|nr:roadblock/LC7 domain-containing protein [candidate division KSB1 bacterium]